VQLREDWLRAALYLIIFTAVIFHRSRKVFRLIAGYKAGRESQIIFLLLSWVPD
jgi:hypothetical protein